MLPPTRGRELAGCWGQLQPPPAPTTSLPVWGAPNLRSRPRCPLRSAGCSAAPRRAACISSVSRTGGRLFSWRFSPGFWRASWNKRKRPGPADTRSSTSTATRAGPKGWSSTHITPRAKQRWSTLNTRAPRPPEHLDHPNHQSTPTTGTPRPPEHPDHPDHHRQARSQSRPPEDGCHLQHPARGERSAPSPEPRLQRLGAARLSSPQRPSLPGAPPAWRQTCPGL